MVRRALKRIYTLPVFLAIGRPLFAMARVPAFEGAALGVARGFAWLVQATYGRRPRGSAAELAEEWTRLMPRPRSAFPLVGQEEGTAFVEIRIQCPLRGTGDAEACWRAMEFDRALLRRVGGSLVVLESQSVTGGECCRLAIRRDGAPLDDREVAHPRWHGR